MRIEKVFVAAIALAFRLMSTASAEPIRIAMPSKSMTFLKFLFSRQIRFVQKMKDLKLVFRQLASWLAAKWSTSQRAAPYC